MGFEHAAKVIHEWAGCALKEFQDDEGLYYQLITADGSVMADTFDSPEEAFRYVADYSHS